MPIWLDTLCIPDDPTWQYLRHFSISRMHSIYKECWGVRVLDPDTDALWKTLTPEELWLRVALSGWASRLWTCQEGALLPRLLFRYRDGTSCHWWNFDGILRRFRQNWRNYHPVDLALANATRSLSSNYIPENMDGAKTITHKKHGIKPCFARWRGEQPAPEPMRRYALRHPLAFIRRLY